MAKLTLGEFEAAKARGDKLLRGPRAVSAHYDVGRDRVIVLLTTGVELGFSPKDAEGLQHAAPEALSVVEVEALGLGLYFPRLDADLYVPALLEGVLGSKSWMATRAVATGAAVPGEPASAGRRATRRRAPQTA